MARHLVQRRYPGEGNGIVAVAGSIELSHLVGGSIQHDLVDTHLGSKLLVVLGKPCSKIRNAGSRAVIIGSAVGSRCGVGSHIGVHVTAVNGDAVTVHAAIERPPQQAVVGDEEVKTRQGDSLGSLLARHRELVLVLDNRCAVVNHVIHVTLHQLAVEVGNVGTHITSRGAELLKHGLERSLLTAVFRPIAIVDVGLQLGSFLARLALTQEEEAVVSAVAAEHRADRVVVTATDAHTVGQQLHRLDVVANVVDQVALLRVLP